MEFTSYEMVATNTASLNTGSYLNRTEYSLFVKGFTSDLWYGFSANDAIEFGLWDRDNNFIGWDVLNQSKSYSSTTLSYLNGLNFPVDYSYHELNPDFILYKNSKILVDPSVQISSSFGVVSGSYFIDYNFTRELAGNVKSPLVIKEISPSRKELKLIPLDVSISSSYNAFCNKNILIQDVSPLYLEAIKSCPCSQIYNNINLIYAEEINTLKSIFFLQSEGAVINFFRNLYEDLIVYTTVPVSKGSLEVVTGSLVRIQGIKRYFTNYLLSNAGTEVDFKDIDNKFNSSVSSSIERKFAPIGLHPQQQYVDAKVFVYDFFTKYFYQPISDVLSQTYKEKYFSYLRNGLNFGNNRILPILQHGMMDEKINPTDPLALLVKLKTELPSDLSIQEKCWVSNISLSPYVVNAIVKNPNKNIVHQIGPPNFSLVMPDVSLTNTNMSYTADDLANSDDIDRELTVSKNIAELNVDYTDFKNFIVFSSAELRLKIFKNKIINISSYSSSLDALNNNNNAFLLASGSTYPFYTEEYDSLQSKVNDVVNTFDGYESYLYRSGNFTYSDGQFISSSYISILDLSASYYDKNNLDSLINNCPSHILTNSDNDDYIIFLSMIGHFFDEIYEYISSLPSEKVIGNNSTEEFTRRVVDYMLQSFGWNLDDSLEQSNLLNNYLTSDQIDGLNKLSAEDRLKTIRNRVLNNLPQIYKTKGTEESVRLILACYGIPSTLLSIREYGGLNYKEDVSSYTTYERAYMYHYDTSSQYNTFFNRLTTDAKTYLFKLRLDDSSIYSYNKPITIMGVVGSGVTSTSAAGSGDWAIGFVRTKNPNAGKIWFRIGYNTNPLFTLYSNEFPLFDGDVYSIMLRRNEPSDVFETNVNIDAIPCKFDLYVQKNEFGRQNVRLTSSQISYDYSTNNYFSTCASASYLVRGGWFTDHNGQGFHGEFDKLQVWYDPISDSNFEDYVNSINAYSYSGSRPAHQSLLFRQHTDYPFDLNQIPPGTAAPIIGVSNVWQGVWRNANPFYATGSEQKQNSLLTPFVAANMDVAVAWNPWSGSQELVYDTSSGCMVSQSCYPFQFKVIDYPSTWGISKYGPNKFKNEKIRHISQSVEARFDINERSTYVNPNYIPTDSNLIGFFADPQDFRNKDIVRYYGNLDLMDFIGNPANQYSSSYDSLKLLRKQYITSQNQYSGSNTLFNELITLYKLYFNRSVFESIKNLIPARSNALVGVLIEPTILERPKYTSKPVYSESNTGSVFYADITASHYFRDPNTKLLRLTMSLEESRSTSLGLSYISLPLLDYPVNYGGNYISDVSDAYSLGHFADGIITNEELAGYVILPSADFLGFPLTTSVGSNVLFTNLSSYAESYTWDFGDGSPVSHLLNPVYSYGLAGTYAVTLIAYSSWGYPSQIIKSPYILVQSQPVIPVVADFTATPLVGTAPLSVTFTNTSTNAYTYAWTFGDGQTSTSTNPTNIYNTSGLYTVTLIATSGSSSSSKIREFYINVGSTPVPPDPPIPTPGGGVSPGGGCLLAGTKIRMFDGSIRKIEDIQVGDELFGLYGSKAIVSKLLPNRYYKYFILNDKLKITYEHPILIFKDGVSQVMATKDLKIGDAMVKYDTTTETLNSIVEIFEETPTYNFTVDGEHMYVAEDIFVHNVTQQDKL